MARTSARRPTCGAGHSLPYLARTVMIAGTHTLGYLVVTGALSLVVYHKAGVEAAAPPVDQSEPDLGRGTDSVGRGNAGRLTRPLER